MGLIGRTYKSHRTFRTYFPGISEDLNNEDSDTVCAY
jgi:hypothetical protein